MAQQGFLKRALRDGLGKHPVHAGGEAGVAGLGPGVGGEAEDGQAGVIGPQLQREGVAVHVGHLDVGEDDVITVRPDLGEVGDGLVATGQAGHAGALLCQHVGQHEAVDLVVVDGQHAEAGQAPLEGRRRRPGPGAPGQGLAEMPAAQGALDDRQVQLGQLGALDLVEPAGDGEAASLGVEAGQPAAPGLGVPREAGIDDDEIGELSPLSVRPWRDVPVHVAVGEVEPDQFRRQSSAFADAWRGSVTRFTTHVAAGRDHFDILDELTTPDSPTFRALVEMTA